MDILPFRTRPSNEQPKSRDGLRAVLTALGYAWRYNLRAHRAELREHGGEWQQANDRLICDIRSQIPERFTEASGAEGDKRKPLAFGRTAFEDCFDALLHRTEVDPFREWLEALPAWDGTGRLDSWFPTVFRVRESGGLAPWASRVLPLGAVWRTYQPGTKIDESPVTVGDQGSGSPLGIGACYRPNTRNGSPMGCDCRRMTRCAPRRCRGG